MKRRASDYRSGPSWRCCGQILGSAVVTLTAALVFVGCAVNLEAWGPPLLLIGTGVGLVGVLLGGVATLASLLRLLALRLEVVDGDQDQTGIPMDFSPRMFGGTTLGPAAPETPDRGG